MGVIHDPSGTEILRGWRGSNRKNHPWERYGYFLESHIIRDFTVWDFKMWPLAVSTGDCINVSFL